MMQINLSKILFSYLKIKKLGDKCGVHHKKGDCVVKDESFFRELVHQNRRFLFPGSSFLPLKRSQEFRRKKLKPNGGWGDRIAL